MDLIIRNASLRAQPGAWDIGITAGHITTVAGKLAERAGRLYAP
jgi:hypothetical protein